MRGYKILWEGKVVKINGSPPPAMVNYCYDKSFIYKSVWKRESSGTILWILAHLYQIETSVVL